MGGSVHWQEVRNATFTLSMAVAVAPSGSATGRSAADLSGRRSLTAALNVCATRGLPGDDVVAVGDPPCVGHQAVELLREGLVAHPWGAVCVHRQDLHLACWCPEGEAREAPPPNGKAQGRSDSSGQARPRLGAGGRHYKASEFPESGHGTPAAAQKGVHARTVRHSPGPFPAHLLSASSYAASVASAPPSECPVTSTRHPSPFSPEPVISSSSWKTAVRTLSYASRKPLCTINCTTGRHADARWAPWGSEAERSRGDATVRCGAAGPHLLLVDTGDRLDDAGGEGQALIVVQALWVEGARGQVEVRGDVLPLDLRGAAWWGGEGGVMPDAWCYAAPGAAYDLDRTVGFLGTGGQWP